MGRKSMAGKTSRTCTVGAKIKKPYKIGRKNIAGKNSRTCTAWAKVKKYITSSHFSLTLL